MTTQVLTPEFRVAFPKVFKAERNDLSGKDEFSLVALFPKGANLAALKNAAKAAAEKKWGADPKKWPKNLHDPFRDQGDREKEDDDGNAYLPAGYEKGAMYLNLKSQKRPGVVDAKVQDIIDETDFYGGCWARAQVNAYAYEQKGNAGISFGLNHVQKTKDGESFGAAARNPSDVFQPVTEGGDSAGGMFD